MTRNGLFVSLVGVFLVVDEGSFPWGKQLMHVVGLLDMS
jgi:hypothetical protein